MLARPYLLRPYFGPCGPKPRRTAQFNRRSSALGGQPPDHTTFALATFDHATCRNASPQDRLGATSYRILIEQLKRVYDNDVAAAWQNAQIPLRGKT
jgi:hypothetical protein